MKKIAISSWGNIKKDVLLDTSLHLEKGILDIGNLNHGLYLIKIMIKGQISFAKIVVN